jgi:hypothetical protein
MPAHGKKKRPSSPGLLHSNASACAGSSRCRAPSRRACDASCCCLPAQFASETPNLPSSGAVLLIASPAFSPPRRPPVTTPTNNARPPQLLAHTDFANSPHSPAASARPLTERARSPRDLPQPRRPVAVHWVSLSARPVPHNHRPQRALPQPLRSRRRRSPPAAPIAGLVLVLAVTSRRPPVHRAPNQPRRSAARYQPAERSPGGITATACAEHQHSTPIGRVSFAPGRGLHHLT